MSRLFNFQGSLDPLLVLGALGYAFNKPLVIFGKTVLAPGAWTYESSCWACQCNVIILGGADIKADSLAAVVAGGNLTVTTKGEMVSKFTGLLYTYGNLSLTDTCTVGAAIAAGSGEVGSLMTIQDSDVIASPEGQSVEIGIQDFANSSGGGMGGWGSSHSGEDDPIIEPVAADLFVEGKFKADDDFIESQVKILHGGIIYDNANTLPADLDTETRNGLEKGWDDAVAFWKARATQLQIQHEMKPVQVVKFDLNEFLNVSDRLRSTQTFYIQG